MAFIPGLSKKQVEKVILNYAEIAPETMQLLDDLSAQINDPNDPAAALIDRMVVVEADVNSLESSVSSLSSSVSGKQDAVAGISGTEIGTLDGIQSNIQSQLDSKAPLSSPTISNPTFTGTVTLPNASIANSKLENSSISINGTSVPLGGNATVIGTTLPSQTDNAGKALVTDGSSLSWETVDVSNLDNPTINIFPENPVELSTTEEAEVIAQMVSGGESSLILYNSSDFQWAADNLLGLDFSGGNYYLEIGSDVPGVPNYILAKILSVSFPSSYATVYLDYTGPSFGNSGFFCYLTLRGVPTTVISSTELSYLDGLTGNVESRLKFDSVRLNENFTNDAIFQLSKGSVYYSDSQEASNIAATLYLYNDADLNPATDPLFTLNGAMTIGQAVTFVAIQKNTSTGVYFDAVEAPKFGSNSTVNLMWQGGNAPTGPNLNATDIYTFTVIKTADDVFDVYADVAKFA